MSQRGQGKRRREEAHKRQNKKSGAILQLVMRRTVLICSGTFRGTKIYARVCMYIYIYIYDIGDENGKLTTLQK
jgi:hypothetical protein